MTSPRWTVAEARQRLGLPPLEGPTVAEVRSRAVEWDLCSPCADAVAVMLEMAGVFGEITAEVLTVLCRPCAQAGLDAIGNGPGADPHPTRTPLL